MMEIRDGHISHTKFGLLCLQSDFKAVTLLISLVTYSDLKILSNMVKI